MMELVQDDERRTKLETFMPSLKQTHKNIEDRLDDEINSTLTVHEFRFKLQHWVFDLINSESGGMLQKVSLSVV